MTGSRISGSFSIRFPVRVSYDTLLGGYSRGGVSFTQKPFFSCSVTTRIVGHSQAYLARASSTVSCGSGGAGGG